LLWHNNHACWFPSKLLHGQVSITNVVL
jgi:hypothetical protein